MDASHETGDRLTADVRTALTEMGVRDETVVVAVSGGPDSVALLHLLFRLSEEFILRLHVAHLNHMLRGELGARDARFVVELARTLGLPCTCEERDVHAFQRTSANSSVEDAARQVRYRFLNETADRVGASRIALGHMADDQAETVLLHLVRGTGLSGLRGMLPVRGRIIRPVLTVRRDEIEEFLRVEGIEYCSDETNESRQFARNKIRAEVIPLLQREFNPRVVDSINRTAQVVRSAEEWAESELDRLFGGLVSKRDETEIVLSVPALSELPVLLRQLAIRRALRLLNQSGTELSLAQTESVVSLLQSPQAETHISLPGGIRAEREGDALWIGTVVEEMLESEWELPIEAPCTIRIPAANITLTCEILPRGLERSELPNTGPHEAFMDWQCVKGNLVIRNRRPGDRFHPLGAPGSRKLKDYFIDIKWPQKDRDRVPLLVDDEGIICVLGHVIAERMRVRANTDRYLHILLR